MTAIAGGFTAPMSDIEPARTDNVQVDTAVLVSTTVMGARLPPAVVELVVLRVALAPTLIDNVPTVGTAAGLLVGEGDGVGEGETVAVGDGEGDAATGLGEGDGEGSTTIGLGEGEGEGTTTIGLGEGSRSAKAAAGVRAAVMTRARPSAERRTMPRLWSGSRAASAATQIFGINRARDKRYVPAAAASSRRSLALRRLDR